MKPGAKIFRVTQRLRAAKLRKCNHCLQIKPRTEFPKGGYYPGRCYACCERLELWRKAYREPPLVQVRPTTPDDEEEWRDVPSVPGVQASSLGRVYGEIAYNSVGSTGGISTKGTESDGRWNYKGKSYRVARLVAEAFHGSPPTPNHCIRWINGNQLDNRPKNLTWVSRSWLVKKAMKGCTKKRAMPKPPLPRSRLPLPLPRSRLPLPLPRSRL